MNSEIYLVYFVRSFKIYWTFVYFLSCILYDIYTRVCESFIVKISMSFVKNNNFQRLSILKCACRLACMDIMLRIALCLRGIHALFTRVIQAYLMSDCKTSGIVLLSELL